MRESTMWASQGGPIIGEIRHGKKYPFGTVTMAKFDEQIAEINERIDGLNYDVVACQGALTGLQTSLDTLSGQYAATVPGLSQAVSDIRVQITETDTALSAAVTRLETSIGDLAQTVQGIDTSLSERIDQTERGLQSANAGISANTQDIAVITANVSSLTSRVDALISKEIHDVDALNVRLTAAEGNIQGLDITLREHSSEISSQGETIGIISHDLGAVTDLATATSATTAANSEAITGIREAIEQMRASITANATAITAINSAIAELTSTQNVDRATLTARIEVAENSVTTLAQTVEGYNTTLSNQISGLRADITVNSQDIAVIKSTLQTQGAAIEAQSGRMSDVESRMNTQEVGMATLRQQLLNSVVNLQDEIARLNTSLTQLDNRVTALENGKVLDIVSFTASPDLCELGGHQNIVLTWEIRGTVSQILLNNQEVTGTTATIPDLAEPTTFTLTIRDAGGNVRTKSVDVNFANHIFYGTSASSTADEGTVKALESSELSEQRARTFSALAQYEYIYYAYPKRLGLSEFMVNDFKGGFENPAVVSIDNHAGYEEDYYVYRSANILNSTFDVHVL